MDQKFLRATRILMARLITEIENTSKSCVYILEVKDIHHPPPPHVEFPHPGVRQIVEFLIPHSPFLIPNS